MAEQTARGAFPCLPSLGEVCGNCHRCVSLTAGDDEVAVAEKLAPLIGSDVDAAEDMLRVIVDEVAAYDRAVSLAAQRIAEQETDRG